jgi:IgA Peptidase M64/Peptidase M64 N-terminus
MAQSFSHPRRKLLRQTGTIGASLLLAACRPAEPTKTSQAAMSDFVDGALRLDWRQWRRQGVEDFTLERMRFERQWPGRRDKLVDALDWGDYRLSIHDADRGGLLLREGFDTGLDPDARSATIQLSVRFPMPRLPVRALIERRRRGSTFQVVTSIAIDPRRDEIDRSAATLTPRVDVIESSGEPAGKVDLAILGDGYQEAEYAKFRGDAERAAGYLFSIEPFNKRRRDFNIYTAFAPSAESGITDPYLGLTKDTVFRSSYYGGGSERTLEMRGNQALREAASAVPYDFLLVLANARRYGGGAHFGGPAVVAIDSAAARYLVIHEFAHVIGGLADEYYIPSPRDAASAGDVEPWHPNVTISPDRVKWRELLPEPQLAVVPTTWNKAAYDKYFASYVQRYDTLRAKGAPESEIEKFMAEESKRQSALLAQNGDQRRVGLYEGAGGHAKGAYRAGVNCIMFSLQSTFFCGACAAAIERMIDKHCR